MIAKKMRRDKREYHYINLIDDETNNYIRISNCRGRKENAKQDAIKLLSKLQMQMSDL
jgi:hypothetical protein